MKKYFSDQDRALNFLKDVEATGENDSYFSLDLKPSQMEAIDTFLGLNNNKYFVAKKYIEILPENSHVPEWLGVVRGWLS
ncbi:hypothetical protein [Modicisalibacter xianhensis]|uniref:hypothetical protein n=1 Tax=Modicisalibacter xianhensis TaxID=442341 RepID=UPI001AB03937|nr:hypothetical protein [Halomonas xianhensis]